MFKPGLNVLANAVLALGLAGQCFAQQTPVKIGVLGDHSSAYADLSGKGAVTAARMAIDDFGGTALGRPVELVFADHQNKPDVATSIARRWYDAEGVDMITDLTNSAVAISVQNISKEKKKIDLVTSTATTALTNENCSPWGAHWTYDSYGLSSGSARALLAQGGKTWFFITADYAFGHNLEATATKIINELGGKVVGSARHPLNTSDFASHLLQAKASGAQVIALANAGTDTSNAIKQAAEFGMMKQQKVAALLTFITDIHSVGLKDAQGLVLTTAFYWDRDDATRAWSNRFFKLHGAMPGQVQAGTYSAVLHYLKAVKAANSKEPDAVMAKMRATPIDDFFAKDGKIREDGRMIHDMYLVQVKSPQESKRDWDYYKILRVIPGDQAFQPLSEGKCALLKK